jgi:nickel-dependent lactate racemase
MRQRIELPWGGGSLAMELPSAWHVLGVLRPRRVAAPPSVADACREALAAPIGAPTLRGRDLARARVVVVTDDHSRPTPVRDFVLPVLAELHAAGAREDAIEFLLATGVHRASRAEEVEAKLGPDVMARYAWRCHDAYRAAGLATVGTTSRGTRVLLNRRLLEADLIVCLGAIEPHLLLGFGGGLKMLVPGCAAAATIGRNHMQGVDPDHFDFVGAAAEQSPMRLDLEEAAGLLRKEIFIVNAVMNEEGRPARFFCGDPVAAHRAGEAFVRDLVRLEVPTAADVVITNSFPMEADLRQSIKCVGNTLEAARPGGVMLGCVRCEHGLGEMPIPKRTLPYPLLRTLVKTLGKQHLLPLVERVKKGEPVEELFIGHFGLQMLRRNHLGLYSDRLPPDTGRKMGLACTFDSTREVIRWATVRAPLRATVWVFPFGGSTYAVRRPLWTGARS